MKRIDKYMKLLYYPLLFKLLSLFKIEKNKVFISNFYGKGYGDNSKYIIDKLTEDDNNYKIVWSVFDDDIILPENIIKARINSLKWIYHLVTAKVWINNCRFYPYVRKRKSQYYIQTWHSSIRLKKIEFDVYDMLPRYYKLQMKNDNKMIDLMTSGSKYNNDLIRNAFKYNGEILNCGTPRFDIFFNKKSVEDCKIKIRRIFNIDINKKIILYAPTFRQYSNDISHLMNINFVIKELENKNFNKFVILVRSHPNEKISFGDNDRIIDVSQYPDMQNLLCACDTLITDYSGCCFDAMYLRKECILIMKDLENYLKKERELYFTFDELPFVKVLNDNDLIDSIINFKYDEYLKKIDAFIDQLGSFEQGKASKCIAEVIKGVICNEKI